jgi:sterol desaturase/sphingolipid hydroxylase (fatty acid hydroxylase superfamily)
VLVSIALSGWVFVYSEAARFAFAPVTTSLSMLLPAVLPADLCYYLEHRAAHRLQPLWMLYHAMHHSSPGYTVATTYRVSFLNQFVAPLLYLPCMHHDISMPAHAVNFGGILVIWERLFGTYVEPRDVHAFGIAGRESPGYWRELYTRAFGR